MNTLLLVPTILFDFILLGCSAEMRPSKYPSLLACLIVVVITAIGVVLALNDAIDLWFLSQFVK